MNRGDFGAAPSYGSTAASYHRTQSAREKDKFNSLCDSVSGKIFIVNKNVSRLETLSQKIDHDVDEMENEVKIHKLSQETNKLAKETKNIFKEISEYTRIGRFDRHDPRYSQYNLLQNKLRKEFENALSRYHAIQNVLSLKMKAHIEQEVSFTQDASSISIAVDDDKEQLVDVQEQESAQQLMLHEQELEQAKEREARILQIEEDMLNVNEIFQDLAALVHDQGEAIDSIESHVEHAALHVEEGNKQLVRAKSYQKSARKKMCIIAVVVIVIAIILGVIIYSATQ